MYEFSDSIKRTDGLIAEIMNVSNYDSDKSRVKNSCRWCIFEQFALRMEKVTPETSDRICLFNMQNVSSC